MQVFTSKGRRNGRGLGPFSGAQLTIVIVAVAAMFAIPTAALAASGAFNSKTAAPALAATSSSDKHNAVAISASQRGGGNATRFGVHAAANGNGGVGVQGDGKKFGVFSNGNLGIKKGKSLSCNGCVAPDALSGAARTNVLRSGESESGSYAAAGGSSTSGFAVSGVSYSRPLPGETSNQRVFTTTWPIAHCAGPGSADPGWLCLYSEQITGMTYFGAIQSKYGVAVYFTVTGAPAYGDGTWTITGPG
jgi:hypothetical protein